MKKSYAKRSTKKFVKDLFTMLVLILMVDVPVLLAIIDCLFKSC